MAGRPKSSFSDQEVAEIDRMSLMNCNTCTIATALNLPYNTINRHFGKRMSKNRAIWKTKLQSAQDKLKENHPAMAIFLGKNELGQTDKVEKTDGLDKTVVALTPAQQKLYAKIAEAVMAEERKEAEVAQRANIKLLEPETGIIEEKTA